MSTGAQRSQRSDAYANVHRIVAAARDVFARDGDTATLSQVAAAAGVANATLYRHFPTRRALATAVYEDIVVNDIKPAILALGKDAPRAAFIDALAHLEDVMFKQRTLLASIGDLADLTAQLLTRDRDRLDDMIMQAQATGELRPDLTSDDVRRDGDHGVGRDEPAQAAPAALPQPDVRRAEPDGGRTATARESPEPPTEGRALNHSGLPSSVDG
jgi:AcrR family transcriptional regulator